MKENGQSGSAYIFVIIPVLITIGIIVGVVTIITRIPAVAAIAGGMVAGLVTALITSFIANFVLRSVLSDGRIVAISTTVMFLSTLIGGAILWSNFFLNNVESFHRNKPTDTVMFAGKIVNRSTGDWNNNRLVLVFEREREIARTTTFRGEFPENNLGVIDGLFVVEIPNDYQFSIADFEANQIPLDFRMTSRANNFFSHRKIIYAWLPEFDEGTLAHLSMKSKNLQYIIYVLNGDIADLPPEIIGGTTEFHTGRLVSVPKQMAPVEAEPFLGETYTLQGVVYNVRTDLIPLKKITVPLDNCKSDIEIHTPYSYSQTYIHKYIREDTTGGSLQFTIPYLTWAKIALEIQSKYGFEENQVTTSTVTYDLYAAPHSAQKYIVTWTEIWENGIANVVKDNQALAVPFRVRTNLIYEINSETQPCP